MSATNTFDSELISKSIAARALTTLNAKLAPLQVFTTDFSSDVMEALSVVNVPVVSSVGSTLKNGSAFNVSNTVKGNAQVTLSSYDQPWGLTAAQIQQGHKLDQAVDKATATLCNTILTDVFAEVTTGSYGSASLTTGDALWDSGDLKTMWKAVGGNGEKNLIMSSDVYANFIPTQTTDLDGLNRYGFDNFVHVDSTLFASGASNLSAVVCNPGGLVVASSRQAVHPAVADSMFAIEPIELDCGLTADVMIWSDPNSREVFADIALNFGVQTGDVSALEYATSA